MACIRLEIAYRGTGFCGWAAQPGLRTVQGELEAALERITRQRIALTVAGRTDAGVHARAQVASFSSEGELPDRLPERLNAVLAPDLAVLAAEPTGPGFDARRDARSRSYAYRVLASNLRDPFEEGRALWWSYPVEFERLGECAAAVVGIHDFTAFTPTDTEHVRFERDVLFCAWSRRAAAGGALLTLEIEADAFMRHMVRVLVGTMLEVAGGRRSVDDFRDLLAGASRDRAGETAPAHGLYLVGVAY